MMTAADELERRGFGFALGALLSSYPGSDFARRARDLSRAAEADELSSLLEGLGSDEEVDDLRSEYLELFDKKEGHIPLYETELGAGQSLAKGNRLADLGGFYRAFGVEIGGLDQETPLPELPDHVSVELEFYGYLLLKEAQLERTAQQEGVEIVRDAERKFLADHLGRFVPRVRLELERAASDEYRRIFDYCAELVRAECARHLVDPGAPLERGADREGDHVQCGALPIIEG